MTKTIGGILSSVLMVLLIATINYWKGTVIQDIFTFMIALVFSLGAIYLGVLVASWLESNDTTKGTS